MYLNFFPILLVSFGCCCGVVAIFILFLMGGGFIARHKTDSNLTDQPVFLFFFSSERINICKLIKTSGVLGELNVDILEADLYFCKICCSSSNRYV